jgi:Zn-dependent protease
MAMYSFRDFLSKLRHHFRFSKEEIEACVISVLVMAFIVSFNEWGHGTEFDFNIGLANLIRAIVIVGVILAVHVIVIKLQAIQYGYRAEFKIWWYGLMIGLGLAFLSASITGGSGKFPVVWFLAPGGIFFHHLAVHRLGWFRYGVNQMETGHCYLMGSISTLVLAYIFKILLYIFPESQFFYKAMVVALWFALFTLLPIPPLVGSHMFFWSRLVYVFYLGIVVGINIFLRLDLNIFIILLLSLVVGLIFWGLMLWKVE